MDDVRIGVIGLGLRRSLAVAAHRPGEGGRVVAACDIDEEALRRGAAEFGASLATTDYRVLLDSPEVEAVIVNTPDHTHEAITLDVLRAGKPVYVEKPLGITIEQCDRILAAARDTGTRLYVGHNMRHMGVVRLMRDIIARGDIGAPQTVWVRHFVGHGGDFYFKDWHADRRNTTGLLLQKAAHDIDVLHWLAGGYTTRVSALGDLLVYGDLPRRAPDTPKPGDWYAPDSNWPPRSQTGLHDVVDVEDVSMMTMRLSNGVLASYQQCHFTPDYWRNYTVIGDAGRLENFGDGPGDTVKVWNARRSEYRDDCDIAYQVPPARGTHGGADGLIIGEFLRFVRDGGVTDTSPVAARMSVATGVQATLSLRADGHPYDVPPLDPELAAYFDRGQTPSPDPD